MTEFVSDFEPIYWVENVGTTLDVRLLSFSRFQGFPIRHVVLFSESFDVINPRIVGGSLWWFFYSNTFKCTLAFQLSPSWSWCLTLALVYVVWPADMIPDWIPCIGLIDDVFWLQQSIFSIEANVRRHREWKVMVVKSQWLCLWSDGYNSTYNIYFVSKSGEEKFTYLPWLFCERYPEVRNEKWFQERKKVCRVWQTTSIGLYTIVLHRYNEY